MCSIGDSIRTCWCLGRNGNKKHMIEQYYNVKSCESFKEYLITLQEDSSGRVAFESTGKQWRYQDIIHGILDGQQHFRKVHGKLIGINIANHVEFTIALLSIITSGNIAVLLDENALDEHISCSEILTVEWRNNCIMSDRRYYSDIFDLPDLDTRSVALIAPSSGTTSEHKYVMLSQRNVLDVLVNVMRCYNFSRDATYLAVLPLSHLFGVLADLLIPLYSGAKVYFSSSKYAFFADLPKCAPTSLNIPPVLVEQLDKRIQEGTTLHDTVGQNLSQIISGGAYLDDEVVHRFKKRGINIYIAYGLTECSPCISINSELSNREGSVGRVLPCCEVRIIEGEITVRGSNVMLGYYNDPDATRKVLRNGWLYTGDLGYLNDGFLYLTGRRSNLIVFEDAFKLVPESLENAINSIVGVRESLVESKAVNGRVKLYITISMLSGGEKEIILDEIRKKCQIANVAAKVGDIQIIDHSLPRTSLGKLIREDVSIIKSYKR